MEKIVNCTYRPIQEFASAEAGYSQLDKQAHPHPFVVRAAPEMKQFNKDLIRSKMHLEREVYGYSADGNMHTTTGREAFETWERDQLTYNVVDSDTPEGTDGITLPARFKERLRAGQVPHGYWLAFVLTIAPNIGNLF